MYKQAERTDVERITDVMHDVKAARQSRKQAIQKV